MNRTFYKQHALFLAILIFISTIGIGQTAVLCKCTSKTSVSILSCDKNQMCCKKSSIPPTVQSRKCCNSKSSSHQQVEPHKKNCCNSDFEFIDADIDLKTSQKSVFSTVSNTLINDTELYKNLDSPNYASLFSAFYLYNKAPPNLYGITLLVRYQIFRC